MCLSMTRQEVMGYLLRICLLRQRKLNNEKAVANICYSLYTESQLFLQLYNFLNLLGNILCGQTIFF